MDTQKLWRLVLAELELTVSEAIYKTAFLPANLLTIENNVATIGVPSPMIRQMIEGRYYSLLKNIIDHHTKENISLKFTIVQKPLTTNVETGPLFQTNTPRATGDVERRARHLHLRPESTFASFAVSSSNQLAFAAATAIAKSPGTAYNPLFLYGGVGVGKTHLMHAVANELLAKNPMLPMVYCMGEEFLNEIVEAIQMKTSRQFKQKYRNAQLLLVDDVQFIAGKQTAQEEFFHTFNAVHRAGGQIILTSDRPPSEISRLEDRLRSRFEGGLIVDVAAPDFELRTAILHIKAKHLGINIPPDAAQLAAGHITDTRALEGFLRRLLNETQLKKIMVSAQLVRSMLQIPQDADNTQPSTTTMIKRVAPLDVLEAVSTYFEIKPMHLKGPKRDRPIARPRQLVMYICKTELNVTLDDIGGLLGGRDHTTVLHGVDKISKEIARDEHLRSALHDIKQKLFTL